MISKLLFHTKPDLVWIPQFARILFILLFAEVLSSLQPAEMETSITRWITNTSHRELHSRLRHQSLPIAPFNNMRTLKFTAAAQPTNAFSRYGQHVRRLLPASDYCRALFCCLNWAQLFVYCALGNSRKLGGAAGHLINNSERRICRLSFEFYRPNVIERRLR